MKFYIATIIILVIFIMGSLILFFSLPSSISPSYTNYVTKKEEQIKQLPNDSFDQIYEINLNNKTLVFNIKANNNIKDHIITGTFNDIVLYSYSYESISNESIQKIFNSTNFYIIKGEDNLEYLLIKTYNNTSGWISLYVFNDELKCLKEFTITHNNLTLNVNSNSNIWYKDTLNICNNLCQIRLKIENNKIYVLVYNEKPLNELSKGYLESRVYTLKDNLLKYEVLDTYNVLNIKN